MAVNIKCQKCGGDNRLGQLFCRECGSKLDLSQLTPQEVARNNRDGRGGISIARMIRLVITLSLLAVLGLLCWPATPAGDAPTAQGAQIVQAKMSALRGAIMRNNEVQESFSEADINGHLNTRFGSGTRSPGGLNMALKEVRIDLHQGRAEVWTKSTLGPVPLTYTADVYHERQSDGNVTFRANAVTIGHMPLPEVLQAKVTQQLAAMFQQLRDEELLLQRLSSVDVEDGIINVSTTTITR